MNKKKNITKVLVLVVSLIVIGVSGTYAYYTLAMSGEATKTTAKSGVFKIISSLDTANALNNTKLKLIDATEKEVKAEKITFTVTSKDESTVDGQYFIYLKNITLSKNLYSKYLKWELLQNGEIKDSGTFEDAVRTDTVASDEAENVETTVQNIKLNEEALQITKKTTDTLIFRIWLENDENVNQISLTEGSFAARLYLEAFPVSELKKS